MITLQQNFLNTFLINYLLSFLDVYDFWGKLGTMGVTSRAGIISVKYKKDDEKIYYTLQTHILQFLRVDCKKR